MESVINPPIFNQRPCATNSPTSSPGSSPTVNQHQILEDTPTAPTPTESTPQENDETPEEIMEKCQELVAPLLNVPNSYEVLGLISEWFNEYQTFLEKMLIKEDLTCPNLGPRLGLAADQIIKIVAIVEKVNLERLEFAKNIREILKNPAFKKLKMLQEQKFLAANQEAKMRNAYLKWSKNPIDKERVPLVKLSKTKPMKAKK